MSFPRLTPAGTRLGDVVGQAIDNAEMVRPLRFRRVVRQDFHAHFGTEMPEEQYLQIIERSNDVAKEMLSEMFFFCLPHIGLN